MDARFTGFGPINQTARQEAQAREPQPEEKPESAKGKAPAKAGQQAKGAGDVQGQIQQTLAKFNAQNFVDVVYSDNLK